MAVEVRRIVTGHNAAGKAIVAADETLSGVSRPGQSSMSRCDIWSSDAMPVDLSDEAARGQKAGFVKRYNYVGTGQGTVVRFTELQPGTTGFMHRTETLDYAILMAGECDLDLDSGETVRLKAGDIVIQRGTMHAWVNRGTVPCKFAFILIDAKPAEAGGQTLRTHYPA